MTKYHINSHGVPAPCKAKPGNCPFGGSESHFDNIEDAQVYVDSVNESEHGLIGKVDSESIVYEIPENVSREIDLDPVLFTDENHKLLKQDGEWIHIDNNGNVIGTMGSPTVIYDNKGNLASVIDKDDTAGNLTLKMMQTMKILSKFNLSKDSSNAMRHANFHNLEENLDEYKDVYKDKNRKKFFNGLEAISRTSAVKGPNKTSELFSSIESNSEASVEFKKQLRIDKSSLVTSSVNADVYKDNLDNIPSAENIPTDTWINNNLDVREVGGKWIAVDPEGQVYGSLKEPAIAVDLEDEKILIVGERDNIEEACRSFEKENPGLARDIASVNLDHRNNSLTKTNQLFESLNNN